MIQAFVDYTLIILLITSNMLLFFVIPPNRMARYSLSMNTAPLSPVWRQQLLVPFCSCMLLAPWPVPIQN